MSDEKKLYLSDIMVEVGLDSIQNEKTVNIPVGEFLTVGLDVLLARLKT